MGTGYFTRWFWDLRELTKGLLRDPLMSKPRPLWQADFLGDIGRADIGYSVFLVFLSIVPAAVVSYVTPEATVTSMARLFGAPLQAVISGFLTSALIFMGSHLNQVPKPYPVAYKLMLRIMALHPLLGFFSFFAPWGPAVALVIHGFFVIRGVRKSYPIPLRNVLLFFGMIYLLFAFMQFQAALNKALPPAPLGTYDYSDSSS